MVITPDSIIKLYRDVDICNDERLVFSSPEKRDTYFANRLVKTVPDCTIVKNQTGMIRLDIPGHIASKCNYMSFINPSFENKEIYCRITMIPEYTNNECTQLAYDIDYWMTYYNDVKFEDMYIDREHLSESKYQLSVDNPYDESLWEFRTNEPLPISDDTNQIFYNTDNFTYLYDKAAEDDEMSNELRRAYYDLIYIGDIDFEALDANIETGDLTPSYIYKRFANGTLDFKIDYSQDDPLTVGAFFSKLVGQYNFIDIITNFKPGYKLIGLCSIEYLQGAGYSTKRNTSNTLSYLLDNLTKWGVVSSVINIYRVPARIVRTIFSTSQTSTALPVLQPQSVDIDCRTHANRYNNKKLANYPFSYMRLVSPLNEDIKEFRYEKFYTAANNSDKVKFALSCDFSERPSLIVSPGSYEYYANDTTNLLTIRNSMIYDKIPTAPYTIDSWLAQMSANAQNIIRNNTTEYMYSMGQEQLGIAARDIANRYSGLSNINDMVSAGVNVWAGNLSEAAVGIYRTMQNTEQLGVNLASTNLARQSLQNRANMSDSAYEALAGAQTGNAVFDNFAETRPAFAANKYVAPSGDGILNYNPLATFDITLIQVSLNDYVLEKYEKWFDNFGYSSGRCGIPYVCQFAQGETDKSKIPHFATMSDGSLSTYLKTNNCRVVHTQAVVSNSIKQLLDNGVRFIKGDDL